MRSDAREAVFKFIFSQLFNPDDEGLFNVLCKDLNEKDKKFATELLGFVLCGRDKYLKEISEKSIGYKLERLFAADKCALLIGMAELDNYTTDTPVVVDEAVKLAAKYSTERSTDFVNGILAEYAKNR